MSELKECEVSCEAGVTCTQPPVVWVELGDVTNVSEPEIPLCRVCVTHSHTHFHPLILLFVSLFLLSVQVWNCFSRHEFTVDLLDGTETLCVT